MIPPYEAIRNLLGLYCLHFDAGDFGALGELFAEGELLDDHGRRIARGAKACTTFWTDLVTLYEGSPRTRHIVSGPVIEVGGDTATCRSSYLALQQAPAGPLEPVAAGRYLDRFVCHDDAWQFASRQYFLDQTGDLTRHLEGL